MHSRTVSITLCVTLALLTGSPATYAQVYKKTLPDGSVIFTDEPTSGGEPVQLEPLQTYPAPPKPKTQSAPATAPTPPKAEQPAASYSTFAVIEPANDSVIRSNNGEVTVVLKLEPALDVAAGHTITLFLDGKPVGKPGTETTIVLQEVDRGTHAVSAVLRDAGKKVLRESGTVTFHLQRYSALFVKPTPLPSGGSNTAPPAPR